MPTDPASILPALAAQTPPGPEREALMLAALESQDGAHMLAHLGAPTAAVIDRILQGSSLETRLSLATNRDVDPQLLPAVVDAVLAEVEPLRFLYECHCRGAGFAGLLALAHIPDPEQRMLELFSLGVLCGVQLSDLEAGALLRAVAPVIDDAPRNLAAKFVAEARRALSGWSLRHLGGEPSPWLVLTLAMAGDQDSRAEICRLLGDGVDVDVRVLLEYADRLGPEVTAAALRASAARPWLTQLSDPPTREEALACHPLACQALPQPQRRAVLAAALSTPGLPSTLPGLAWQAWRLHASGEQLRELAWQPLRLMLCNPVTFTVPRALGGLFASVLRSSTDAAVFTRIEAEFDGTLGALLDTCSAITAPAPS